MKLGGFKVVGCCVAVAVVSACGSVPAEMDQTEGLGWFDAPAPAQEVGVDEPLPEPDERTVSFKLAKPDFDLDGHVLPLSVPPPANYPPPDAGTDAGMEDPVCRDRFCTHLYMEKDISFILINLPCPDAIKSIKVTDLVNNPGQILNPSIEANQPSHCDENLMGIKLERIDTPGVELCLETEGADREVITIQAKAGLVCETLIQGEGDCDCECREPTW